MTDKDELDSELDVDTINFNLAESIQNQIMSLRDNFDQDFDGEEVIELKVAIEVNQEGTLRSVSEGKVPQMQLAESDTDDEDIEIFRLGTITQKIFVKEKIETISEPESIKLDVLDFPKALISNNEYSSSVDSHFISYFPEFVKLEIFDENDVLSMSTVSREENVTAMNEIMNDLLILELKRSSDYIPELFDNINRVDSILVEDQVLANSSVCSTPMNENFSRSVPTDHLDERMKDIEERKLKRLARSAKAESLSISSPKILQIPKINTLSTDFKENLPSPVKAFEPTNKQMFVPESSAQVPPALSESIQVDENLQEKVQLNLKEEINPILSESEIHVVNHQDHHNELDLPLTELQREILLQKKLKEEKIQLLKSAAEAHDAEVQRRSRIFSEIKNEVEEDEVLMLYDNEFSYSWPISPLPINLFNHIAPHLVSPISELSSPGITYDQLKVLAFPNSSKYTVVVDWIIKSAFSTRCDGCFPFRVVALETSVYSMKEQEKFDRYDITPPTANCNLPFKNKLVLLIAVAPIDSAETGNLSFDVFLRQFLNSTPLSKFGFSCESSLGDIMFPVKTLKSVVSNIVSFSHAIQDISPVPINIQSPPKLHPVNLFARPCSFYSLPTVFENSARHVEVGVVLVKSHIFELNTDGYVSIVSGFHKIGLDVLGFRLAWLNEDQINHWQKFAATQFDYDIIPNTPCLAIAFGGGHGKIDEFLDFVGPSDISIAVVTDPSSLRAVYGKDRKDNVLYCSRRNHWGLRDLAFWFGGRILPNSDAPIQNQATFLTISNT